MDLNDVPGTTMVVAVALLLAFIGLQLVINRFHKIKVEVTASEEYRQLIQQLDDRLVHNGEISVVLGIIKALKDNAAQLRESNIELLQYAHYNVQAVFIRLLDTTSAAARQAAEELQAAEKYHGKTALGQSNVDRLRAQRDRLVAELVRIQDGYTAYLTAHSKATRSETATDALS